MEKNDSWDWDSEYLDPKTFPYIKCIDASLVKEVRLPPPDNKLISTRLLDISIPIDFVDNGLIDNKPLEPEIPYSLFIWPLI